MIQPTARPVRVLHVLEALEGGTARHVVDVVRHVPGVEHVVAIPTERTGWATDRRASQAISDAGGRVVRVDMRRSPLSRRNGSALVTLRRLVRHLRPAVVHGHSSIGGALARLATWGVDVPVIYTPNGLTSVRLGLAMERVLAGRTSRLVAVSASEGHLAVRLRLVRPDRVAVIPNGVDLDIDGRERGAELRRELGIPVGATVVGTVSRLVPQKAPEVFVGATALVARHRPDLHVVLIGAGPLRSQVRLEAEPLGARFHLVEFLEGAGAALAAFDVFALASRFEGGPYAPLEAMRAKVPVVLTDVVGNRDVVADGGTGWLVPVDDPVALAGALTSVLSDAEERDRRVTAASERLARYDVRRMGAALGQLYDEVVSGG